MLRGELAIFRKSTLAERELFYKTEFSLRQVKKWFKQNKIPLPQLCVIDAGTETGIILDRKNKGKMLYFEFKKLIKKIKKYVPEDVYYDRSYYKNPKKVLINLTNKNLNNFILQELAFDIDVENANMKLTNQSLKKLYKTALILKKYLTKKLNFKDIEIIYSGHGFHVHVLDKRAYKLTIQQRDFINKQLEKLKYPIDPWVSKGYIRLIRMPYTLNSLVSRKVLPINIKKGFISKETIPKFMEF